MNIPFVDLKRQYLSIKVEIDNAIQDVITETSFIGGSHVRAFENDFATQLGLGHCVGVANGTDAIYIVLKMLGLGHGDEVITVANSWISTSETISQTGAKPVFVDVDDYFTIDVEKIKAKITPATKAIIPVHLYGHPADLDRLVSLCKVHNLYLIEDCAQSHLSKYDGRYVGTFGIASTFSFYPGKNLGAYGDAGAILTDSADLAQKCRMYANHGALQKHHHLMEGINSRLDGLQAAILRVKLKYLREWTEARVRNADFYSKVLSGIKEITLPSVRERSGHTYHLYVIKVPARDKLKNYLSECGIETSIHYPAPLPLLPCYRYLKYTPEDFPVATKNQETILSLPMFPELSEKEIMYVGEKIKAFYSDHRE